MKKKIFTVIENWGKFKRLEPVFNTILNSVKIQKNWIRGKLRGQIERGQIVLDTQKEIRRIENQITEHRQKTNEEINNNIFLTLMEQEEYVNPFTNETERGSNQWSYRWVNENGDVIYTDSEDYNPNLDINIHQPNYKKTQVRKRFPQE